MFLCIIFVIRKTFLNGCSPSDPAISFACSCVYWIEIRYQKGICWITGGNDVVSWILNHYVCNVHVHWLWRQKSAALKSLRLCHESSDDVTSLATRRSNVTKTFWKIVLSEWIRRVITRFEYSHPFSQISKLGDNTFVIEWFSGINHIILRLQIHVLPLRKTKFATIKWYNLCLQIIQSQTCYPLIYWFGKMGGYTQVVI